jgi:FlaA1/EpsC-like NDP-sugar epimerase
VSALRADAASTAELANDLLDRSPNGPYSQRIRELTEGKKILVTGAGGSIGSEIVRQLVTLDPAIVYQLDHDESALHALQLQLDGHGMLDTESTVLADVRDQTGMRRTMRDLRPDIVYHAAAHKHLPLLERFPGEGVKTNVLGTRNVVAAAVEMGVARVINISTDKAARPTSVLGTTKRIAEMVVRDYAGHRTRLASVRFGNVLGSRGSFLDTLSFQLASGVPVTVTHKEVTRFFMTIPEAAGLVIEASAMADAGETYVLDMGEPVRIVELVNRFVERSGVSAPELRYTGLRPGEKLHEQLFDSSEQLTTTENAHIWTVKAKDTLPDLFRDRVSQLYELAALGHTEELLCELADLLPDDPDGRAEERPSPSRSEPEPSTSSLPYRTANVASVWRERARALQRAAGAAGVVVGVS